MTMLKSGAARPLTDNDLTEAAIEQHIAEMSDREFRARPP